MYFAADLFISITDFFGDLILIYRCWLIWSGNYYVCILPMLTSIGGLSECLMSNCTSVDVLMPPSTQSALLSLDTWCTVIMEPLPRHPLCHWASPASPFPSAPT